MRAALKGQPHTVEHADQPESVSSAHPCSDPTGATPTAQRTSGFRPALAVAVLGFFVITLDALVVNVALPAIGRELGGGITGLQWVVDGYTLLFAALLLSAGALSDRIGARKAYGVGLALFVVASAAIRWISSLAASGRSR
jgi:MFS transporter, DHA2 family, methylenomycin A resistance protein